MAKKFQDFEKADIVEVISRYTDLTLSTTGTYYTGFCPLHTNVNTPALVVYPNDGPDSAQWLCYGCHPQADDVIAFVMLAEDCSFSHAKHLCTNEISLSTAFGMWLGREQSTKNILVCLTLRAYDLFSVSGITMQEVLQVFRQLDVCFDEQRWRLADKILGDYGV